MTDTPNDGMCHFLTSPEYSGKDTSIVAVQHNKIVGQASYVLRLSDHILSLHPDHQRA